MPFNITDYSISPNPSVLEQTFPTFVFWKFKECFVPCVEVAPPQQQWNEFQRAAFVERLIRREEKTSLILREIESPYHKNVNEQNISLSRTHTIFEVRDGWNRILAIQQFQMSNDVQKILYLPESICSVPAFQRLNTNQALMQNIYRFNLDIADAIAYDTFTMINVQIIVGVPNRNNATHQTLANAKFNEIKKTF